MKCISRITPLTFMKKSSNCYLIVYQEVVFITNKRYIPYSIAVYLIILPCFVPLIIEADHIDVELKCVCYICISAYFEIDTK